MQCNKSVVRLTSVLAIFVLSLFLTSTLAFAQKEKVVLSFNNTNGYQPAAGLIFDSSGNLYGTTTEGSSEGVGCVFEMSPKAGAWTEQVLSSFNISDGFQPYAGLVRDSAGNLYGTASGGGSADGDGVVFELTQNGGTWTEIILHTFHEDGTDGGQLQGSLIFDRAGNLYGTTVQGGKNFGGTVFELSPGTGGAWTETILYNFPANGTDGSHPYGSVVFDTAGNLYGTTHDGGTGENGTVFELKRAGGNWSEKVLHRFNDNGVDGTFPSAGLIFDGAGNLYGTTSSGGTFVNNGFWGTVFELVPQSGSAWKEKVLHSFGSGFDGRGPQAPLVLDASGNLYGTTASGGTNQDGSVFVLKPKSGGGWSEKVVHSFNVDDIDGYNPQAGLILDKAGNLYGTTLDGGANGDGTVFQIKP